MVEDPEEEFNFIGYRQFPHPLNVKGFTFRGFLKRKNVMIGSFTGESSIGCWEPKGGVRVIISVWQKGIFDGKLDRVEDFKG